MGFGVVDFKTHQTMQIPFPSDQLVTDPNLKPSTPDGIHGMAVSSQKHKVLINSINHNATFIYDTKNLTPSSQPIATVHWPIYQYLRTNLTTGPLNSLAYAIDISPDQKRAYVSLTNAEKILIIDLETNHCVQDPALIASPPVGNPDACQIISTGARTLKMITTFNPTDRGE